MTSIFNKKSRMEIIQKKYEILMSQWNTLSSVNWVNGGIKFDEAEKVLLEIEQIQIP